MKNYFKIFATLMIAILTLACAEEKETALNISDIKGSATVEGKIEYDAGYNTMTNQLALLPASGYKVYVYLELDSLDDTYDGRTTFSTTTNTDGSFSITLPATAKGLSYSLSMESFETKRWIANTGANSSEEPYIQKDYFFTNTELTTFKLYENINRYEYMVCNIFEEIQ